MINYLKANRDTGEIEWATSHPSNPSKTQELQSPHFTAYTYCGACGSFALHGIREPRPGPVTPTDLNSIRERMHGWTVVGPTEPHESTYDVIRTCDCGHEWGQR